MLRCPGLAGCAGLAWPDLAADAAAAVTAAAAAAAAARGRVTFSNDVLVGFF